MLEIAHRFALMYIVILVVLSDILGLRKCYHVSDINMTIFSAVTKTFGMIL